MLVDMGLFNDKTNSAHKAISNAPNKKAMKLINTDLCFQGKAIYYIYMLCKCFVGRAAGCSLAFSTEVKAQMAVTHPHHQETAELCTIFVWR